MPDGRILDTYVTDLSKWILYYLNGNHECFSALKRVLLRLWKFLSSYLLLGRQLGANFQAGILLGVPGLLLVTTLFRNSESAIVECILRPCWLTATWADPSHPSSSFFLDRRFKFVQSEVFILRYIHEYSCSVHIQPHHSCSFK